MDVIAAIQETQIDKVFEPTSGPGTHPLLFFVPGGGFVGGARQMDDTLIYCNVGAFFAARGFLTLIPDYRLLPQTRWFDCDQVSTRWITTTAGQRYVSINESQFLNEWSPIWVRDFNLYNVRRARLQAQRGRDEEDRTDGGARKQRVRVVEGSSVITSSGLFENDLESSLPYCEVRTEGTYRFDGALIDEERILGLKLEDDGVGLKSFDVLMIG
ncbi:hypothetical protein EWM64_g5658 [Hericium alpestre]|uniref:Alpha/beta hydrolase fold-3 domain-containing protein n=1 Tax=Hericium alpestre TaxID=135208 RepID=A0A4Y9ZY35_9AGAM|nr:hypothetical protein EWM64_g5658 [Hericium alpestre]